MDKQETHTVDVYSDFLLHRCVSPFTLTFASYRTVLHRIVSHRIASYRSASYQIHRIVTYRIVSHRIVLHRNAYLCLMLSYGATRQCAIVCIARQHAKNRIRASRVQQLSFRPGEYIYGKQRGIQV